MNTVTEKVPAVVKFAAGIVAVRLVALTKVVESGEPFQLTTDPATKFVPVRLSETFADPTVAEFGEMDVKVGTGLLEAVTVSSEPLVVAWPSGFVTVSVRVPAAAEPDAVTFTVT